MASPTTSVQPEDVIRRIGDTNDQALAYVLDPDPRLSRLSRRAREAIITDLPPVTAGALLGPAALARHFVASAASGRYRDLFPLWELFRMRPDECRPILAERQRALEKARMALRTAVRLGLSGHAERVAEDVANAQGLIWQWLRETLVNELPAVGQRPAIASALLLREPGLQVPLPGEPDERWLAEAAETRQSGPLASAVEALLGTNAHRLPATIPTLSLAFEHYPDRLPELVSRIDLSSPSVGALIAWARDHGLGDRVVERVKETVEHAAARGRAQGVSAWHEWQKRGVKVPLPDALRAPNLDGLDVSRPETAALAAVLIADGAPLTMQEVISELATRNRQLAEKAYEAFVCAGLEVSLPPALEGNPLVKEGTRCPYCQSWTYVRAGHERRCPRRPEHAATALPPAMVSAGGPPAPAVPAVGGAGTAPEQTAAAGPAGAAETAPAPADPAAETTARTAPAQRDATETATAPGETAPAEPAGSVVELVTAPGETISATSPDQVQSTEQPPAGPTAHVAPAGEDDAGGQEQ